MPRTLLLADDSETIRKVVAIVFAHEDFTVTAVANGDDAIARARELKPDIVLADVVMPGLDGYQVCEAIKADPSTQHIPVLLLAGTFEPFDEARALEVGADGHMPKPFESTKLVEKVKELVGAGPIDAQQGIETGVGSARGVAAPVPAAPAPAAPSGGAAFAAAVPAAPVAPAQAAPAPAQRPSIPMPPGMAPFPPRAPQMSPPPFAAAPTVGMPRASAPGGPVAPPPFAAAPTVGMPRAAAPGGPVAPPPFRPAPAAATPWGAPAPSRAPSPSFSDGPGFPGGSPAAPASAPFRASAPVARPTTPEGWGAGPIGQRPPSSVIVPPVAAPAPAFPSQATPPSPWSPTAHEPAAPWDEAPLASPAVGFAAANVPAADVPAADVPAMEARAPAFQDAAAVADWGMEEEISLDDEVHVDIDEESSAHLLGSSVEEFPSSGAPVQLDEDFSAGGTGEGISESPAADRDVSAGSAWVDPVAPAGLSQPATLSGAVPTLELSRDWEAGTDTVTIEPPDVDESQPLDEHTPFLRGPAIEAFTPPAHAADTQAGDTHAAATQAGDTYAADTYAADTYAADTYAADTYAADTYAADTHPAVPHAAATQADAETADAVAVATPVDGGEAVLRAALSAASREVIEKIAWEVVPQLAEVILREHVERLIKSREGRS